HRDLLDEAERYYSESLVIRRQVRDRQGEGITLPQLGRGAGNRGALEQAQACFQQALAIPLGVQGTHKYAAAAVRAGTFFIEQRQKRDEGCALLQQAIELYAQMGAPEEHLARETAQRLGCDQPVERLASATIPALEEATAPETPKLAANIAETAT